jgi:predicted RNA-binding Zn ribbon-like protein
MPTTEFVFEAGNLALDLVNTRPVSGGVRQDYLSSRRDLAAWLRAAGLSAPGGRAPRLGAARRNRLMDDALALRDAIESLVSKSDRARPDPRAVSTINRILATKQTVPALRVDGRRFTRDEVTTSPDASAILAPVAMAAVDLLTDTDPERIRQCDDAACVLWFLDTSKNGRRRWCSMARCGNRAKVAAHYYRGTRRKGK